MNRFAALVLILALLASVIPAATAPIQTPLPLQPILLDLAVEHPEQTVNVIVQQFTPDGQAQALVEELGGFVTHDLSIINAFAADLPAATLPILAKSQLARFISLNAGMVDSQAGNELTYTTWAGELGTGVNSKAENFKNEPIAAGNTIWFSGAIKGKDMEGTTTDVTMTDVVVSFNANGEDFEIELPDGRIEYRPGVTSATTVYDEQSETWVTVVPASYDHETFVTGFPFYVDEALPGGIDDVTWSARVLSNKADAELKWQWAAAVYTQFSDNFNELGVKPVNKTDAPSDFTNDDENNTPENFRAYVVAGARGDGGDDYTGDFSGGQDVLLGFDQAESMVEANATNGAFVRAGWGFETLAGLDGVFTPGYVISKVEIVARVYVDNPVDDHAKIVLSMDGWHKDKELKKEWVNGFVGSAAASDIYIDVTDARNWQWHELADLQLYLDHTNIEPGQAIHYDAIGLYVTSVPGTPVDNIKFPKIKDPKPIDTSHLVSVYNQTIGATKVWNEAPAYIQGQGVTIAIVDSGVGKGKGVSDRKFKDVNFNRAYHDGKDAYGHGTFVAGVAAGNGRGSKDENLGVAPFANLINVRVSDDQGMSTEADVIAALAWVTTNQESHAIRVVNLSLNSSVAESYHVSPLSAAVEFLWLKGIVVVVSAGNNGTADLYPPANDPFVVTVGAINDMGSADITDDVIASFSAYGTVVQTQGEGVLAQVETSKPDLVAPGKDIIMDLPGNDKLTMGNRHRSHQVTNDIFRMSGTSVSAPMVTGAVALLLQVEPNLTPDQVKHRLMSTARQDWVGYDPARAGAGILNIYDAIHSTSMDVANRGNIPSQILRPAIAQALGSDVNWNSVNWNSVNWNSVNWHAVNWNSVNWNSVNWNSVNWNSVNWNSVNWNSDYWGD